MTAKTPMTSLRQCEKTAERKKLIHVTKNVGWSQNEGCKNRTNNVPNNVVDHHAGQLTPPPPHRPPTLFTTQGDI